MTSLAEPVTETIEERENLQSMEELTKKCDELQRSVLAEILTQNANTEYLKRFGLEGATDRDTFKSKVPVVTYEDILPDIQRIASGDFSPILCAQPISEFFASSGTSGGESKLIPGTAEDIDRRMEIHPTYLPILNRYIPGLDKGKALNFLFVKEETTTPGGIVVRTLLTSVIKTYISKYPSHAISPIEAILCLDSFQSMYTQMLCGLYSRGQVNRIGAIFASSLLRVIRFLQEHYTNLCNDISTGNLNSKITDPGIRACMAKIMRPDPELAEFISHECRDENWEGIIKSIWPNTKYLDVIVTGSMAQYIPTLDYYSGGLPKVTSFYGCSECNFGFNLNPLCDPSEICYTIIPSQAYFEFIPLDNDSSDDSTTSALQPVDLPNVEVGKEYEVVVTTFAGLYRYRVGDVVEVTGFYNSTPKVKFARRKNVLLSIDVDKTNESDLQKAIGNASALLQPLNTSIVDYTSYADTKAIPGHYVIYLELLAKDPMNGPNRDVLDKCCLEMEEALDTIYRQGRHLKSIGPLEIRVVKDGAFEALMDYAVSRGASINQFKMPRCIKLKPMLELLDSNVVSTHFSPSLPHWSP